MRLSRLLAVAAFAGAVSVTACGHNTAAPPTTGTISVHVVDANNAGVSLVSVKLNKVVNGVSTFVISNLTNSTGFATFIDVTPGSYSINISFNGGYQLAATETNDKAVTVTAGVTSTVTFNVVKLSGAGGA
jgi:hypothetical protein